MSEKCENYPVGIVDRLREFMESEARSVLWIQDVSPQSMSIVCGVEL